MVQFTAKDDTPRFCCCGGQLTRHQRAFCSKGCSNIGKVRNGSPRVTRQCNRCGENFFIQQRYIRRGGGKFCSRLCAGLSSSTRTPEERREARRLNNLLGVRRYQARLISQTPHDADQLAIREFYANCQAGHEVDHIIPISRGGLHHQDNLQYLPMLDNRRKSNKLDFGSLTRAAKGLVS